MNKNEISLRYKKGLVIDVDNSNQVDSDLSKSIAASFAAATAELGFIPSKELMEALRHVKTPTLRVLYVDVIETLKEMIGDNVKHNPMYKNFPDEVMNKDEGELYFNAIIHYLTRGQWFPESVADKRLPFDEDVEYREIKLLSEKEVDEIFDNLITSNDSLSPTDKEAIQWFIDHRSVHITYEIPFKENMCYLAGLMFERGMSIQDIPKTATDVLRIATHLSGGDISLGENTKFKNLPRFQRKELVKALEKVIREEDIARHSSKWVRLAHNLHVGDYSKKVYDVIKKVRENERIETFNSKVEEYVSNADAVSAVNLLKKRPGDFCRRIDHLTRITSRPVTEVVNEFSKVIDDVPTRTLMQLYGNLKIRDKKVKEKIIFPKGSLSKVRVIDVDLKPMSVSARKKLMKIIENSLQKRFKSLNALGNVYIDPVLKDAPLPSGLRSASKGSLQVARGTHMPIGDKKVLRFFVYWKGDDIDLSATFHNKNFRYCKDVSYYNLRGGKCCHSGDITSAPNGASEFIDIDIDYALSRGWRYILMDVRIYRGPPTFADHEVCFAGWMTRNEVQSGEIYEPKSVEGKVDLTSESRNAIPVVFDLEERVAIWTDLSHVNPRVRISGNNATSNRGTLEHTLKAITSCDNKPTLYDLFSFHANARGTIVDDPEKADVVFDMKDVYKTDVINSEYLV